ncbi:Snf2 family helicase, putative [Candidatus Moduliflexus flocculans]|uniref:Snf2 family helicase, putative n=1 Tax=Candidatus Moduliflexus flocculans TaxID=1499966 RepID=A0A0S6VR13_9BACT|nr:Snf2 family helicase, putative [Candidatus Moduliflexus flocculans]
MIHQEWIEWLETAQPNLKQHDETPEAADVSSKRCPQCGWLDHASVSECFRCGYNYLTDDMSSASFNLLRIGLPAPDIQATAFEEWKAFSHRVSPQPIAEFALRLQAEQFRLVRGFDRLISLHDLNIIHYDHQLQTALTVLNTMRGQALLADEVGLGKTIEAAIIMKELLARGLVKRILILTPASLMNQWQDELQTKFGEEFVIAIHDEDWQRDKVIASISRLRLPKKRQTPANAQENEEDISGALHILRQEYDLVIIDEAHKLKHRATQRFKFVSQIRKKYMLMLTATPVHNNLTELYNLVTLLKPGLLGTIRSFKRHFVASADARRPKNEQHLKTLLASVMIRNRRSDVNIRFPARKSAIYHLSLSEKEQQLYEHVSAYIREEFKAQTKHEFHLLSLTMLQKELCSSARAVKTTLEKIAAREQYPDDAKARLRGFAEFAGDITKNRKIDALLELLTQYPGKCLVFTEFLETMGLIRERLDQAGIAAQTFHGSMDLAQRRDAMRHFQRTARVMISTQTGGEGFNLQFCHQLVNFDLPWNPMMVEQRIGRLHRLGQQEDVLIFNFSMHNTIEAHVLDLLSRKIRMFELVVGELDLILSEVEDHKTFEHAIQDIWISSKDDDDMRQRFDRFGDRLTNARKAFEKVKEAERLTSELFEV